MIFHKAMKNIVLIGTQQILNRANAAAVAAPKPKQIS